MHVKRYGRAGFEIELHAARRAVIGLSGLKHLARTQDAGWGIECGA